MAPFDLNPSPGKPDRQGGLFAAPAEVAEALGLRPYEFRRAFGHRVRWIAGRPLLLAWRVRRWPDA